MDIGLHCLISWLAGADDGPKACVDAPLFKTRSRSYGKATASKTVGEPIHQPELNHKAAASAY
jgi:hypothetical protein